MSLSKAFAGLEEAKGSTPSEPKPRSAQEPKRLSAPSPDRSAELQKFAKSTHPDYEPVKIYVRSATRKLAWRKWEDSTGGDFSDLVEDLLQKYLST